MSDQDKAAALDMLGSMTGKPDRSKAVVKEPIATESTCTDNAENYTGSENVSKKERNVSLSGKMYANATFTLAGTPVIQGDKP